MYCNKSGTLVSLTNILLSSFWGGYSDGAHEKSGGEGDMAHMRITNQHSAVVFLFWLASNYSTATLSVFFP